MRMIESIGITLRDAPNDALTTHHRLLLRAAYISPHPPGRFTLLPLGERFAKRLINLIEASFSALSPQAVQKPLGLPAPSFLADVSTRHVRSLKHLPRCLWYSQQEIRPGSKSRLGLFSAMDTCCTEFYTLAGDERTALYKFDQLNKSLQSLLERCEIPFVDGEGYMGDIWGPRHQSHPCRSYFYVTEFGEDLLFTCPKCGYRAHKDAAKFTKHPLQGIPERHLERIATPDCKTIASLTDYLGIPETSTAKAVFLIASIPDIQKTGDQPVETFVFAILRGDMEINEKKLASVLGAVTLRPASDAEIRAVGAVPGYASPVGLQPRAQGSLPVATIIDDLIPISPNLVGGANIEGYHYTNVNYGRDFTAQFVADIAACRAGDPCPNCEAPLEAVPAVEIARTARMNARTSQEYHCTFQNTDGQEVPIEICMTKIDLHRLMACIIETNHDDAGMTLPVSVAPYQIHLIHLPDKNNTKPIEEADRLYRSLEEEGWHVLYDDRDERSGVKFNDADLIGLPVRLTVSTRSLEAGGVEFKLRTATDKQIIAMSEIIPFLRSLLPH